MTDRHPDRGAVAPPARRPDDRRRARALRENLRRRKAQAQARADAAGGDRGAAAPGGATAQT